jgi:vanillate O-demethylase ferredoxin subunit
MRFALSWTETRIGAVRQVTPTVRLFEIVPNAGPPLAHAPGSHINVGIVVDGRPDTRSYSLVGEADGRCYRIAVKRHPDSRGGSAYMWSLAEGARLNVSDPQALFGLDYGRSEYLLVAGGIGITPIVGMAKTLKRRGERVRLAYAARASDELAFADELGQVLGADLQTFVSSEGQRLDLAQLFGRLGADAQVALCGPLPMLDEARRQWQALGRPAVDLRFETFASSGKYAPEEFVVRVPQRGQSITVPETMTMLDALGKAGIDIMSDCLRGECGLCAVDVLAVEGVIDHRDVFFSDAQKAENKKICACVSRAIGTITIDPLYRPD